MTHFVVAIRNDGSEMLLTSHTTLESAERILRMLCVGPEFVEVQIVQRECRPEVTRPTPLDGPAAATQAAFEAAKRGVPLRARPTKKVRTSRVA